MEKYQMAVSDFITKMNYLENNHVLGIIVYGSYVTGYNNKNSDIDMHIIKDNIDERLYRGVSNVDGFKIEYFEKPISDIYLSIENDFETNENAYLTIIGHGKILFDRTGDISKLQGYILEKYSQPLPALSGDDAKEIAVIIDNRMIKLRSMLENDKPEFIYNYYLIVEKIRKFYSRLCGCANIPVDKAFRIYTDKRYRESFCKSVIPDEEFLGMYFNAVTTTGTNEEKMNIVTKLYNYVTRNLEINPNNYRILIKSRNNPMNRNHE